MKPTVYAVADIMTRQVVTLREEDDLALVDAIFGLAHLRHLPVVRDGRLVGLVSHRDLLRCFADRGLADARSTRAGTVMTRELLTATPTTPLRTAARSMVRNKYGCLPVVDGAGRLVGIITEADITRFAAMLFEELDEVAGVATSSLGAV